MMKAGEAHKLHEAYDPSEGLGGSSVAAALGMSKFKTKRQLYESITNPDAPRPESRFMYWGRMLEDAIATSFTERTGLRLRRSHRTFKHPVHPFLIAHVDRLGYGFVFEAKTAGTFAGKLEWGDTVLLDEMTPEAWADGGWRALVSDDIPDDYGLQLQHYMALTRKKHAFLVVLVGGNEAKLYHAEYDEELYREMILPGLVSFWRDHVVPRIPPELVAEDEEYVRDRFPRAEDDLIISPTDITEHAGENYLALKALIAEYEKKAKLYRARLEEAIGEHEGMIGGTFKVTWRNDPDREEVAWELVAAGYKAALDELRAFIGTDDVNKEEAEFIELVLKQADELESIHTNKKKGSRRFLITEIKKERE